MSLLSDASMASDGSVDGELPPPYESDSSIYPSTLSSSPPPYESVVGAERDSDDESDSRTEVIWIGYSIRGLHLNPDAIQPASDSEPECGHIEDIMVYQPPPYPADGHTGYSEPSETGEESGKHRAPNTKFLPIYFRALCFLLFLRLFFLRFLLVCTCSSSDVTLHASNPPLDEKSCPASANDPLEQAIRANEKTYSPEPTYHDATVSLAFSFSSPGPELSHESLGSTSNARSRYSHHSPGPEEGPSHRSPGQSSNDVQSTAHNTTGSDPANQPGQYSLYDLETRSQSSMDCIRFHMNDILDLEYDADESNCMTGDEHEVSDEDSGNKRDLKGPAQRE
ncbi:hypothetical protein P175DRAFT_0520437 [Aspergillus ochraceoroseus IBT 24754]|uniref:Uncharacterized protein n=1 Tax=Aspergillus ochraceoroseus IBT 24754 TaxID=1392256 RepID=A0A2T5M7M9_9EURO|nr:uncharacterized protein P175DRAFT_0520437 [Aspergillus ochraceoroseus IBT 24754]PTU24527.1 hypothetical protein P175DRAFT_0520437 [Aspergillus ochraceoroseus IBT 24754]